MNIDAWNLTELLFNDISFVFYYTILYMSILILYRFYMNKWSIMLRNDDRPLFIQQKEIDYTLTVIIILWVSLLITSTILYYDFKTLESIYKIDTTPTKDSGISTVLQDGLA